MVHDLEEDFNSRGRSNTSISLLASSINSRCAITCPALAVPLLSIPDAAGLPVS
jgi:hypothetical protein